MSNHETVIGELCSSGLQRATPVTERKIRLLLEDRVCFIKGVGDL